ncbi:serine/threonine-protein kinase PknH/PknJ [Mycobacterium sp. ML4]
MLTEEQFGDYRLIELIGRGGMGEVYRAFDTTTERMVALKVLAEHLAADDNFQQRFRREALAAAGLNEPHVVPIHRFGDINGRLYVDMRLIEGKDLDAVLQAGALLPRQAVGIVRQVAAALGAAHRVGLVHRDVKPSNILVTDDEFAYLIDFGIARAVDQSALTSTGMAVGTLAYMAPERFRGDSIDPRSDVYALAAVLHQCLTGQRPFPGENAEQQMMAHLTAPPPRPSAVSPELPLGFDAVVAKGMAKDPDERYQTGAELAQAAYDVLAAQGSVSAQPTSTLSTEAVPVPPPAPGTLRPKPLRHNDSEPAFAKRRRKALLAAAAAVLMSVAVVVSISAFANRNEKTALPGRTSSALPTTGIAARPIDALLLTNSEITAATGISDLKPNPPKNKPSSGYPTDPPECGPVYSFLVESLVTGSSYVQLLSATYKFSSGNADGLLGQGVIELPSPEMATALLSRITGAWRQCEGKVYKGADANSAYKLNPLDITSGRTTALAVSQRRNTASCQDVVSTVQSYLIKTEACGNIDRTVGSRLADALAAKVRG